MTKAELIKQLENYPDDAEIYLRDIEDTYRGNYRDVFVPLNVIHYYEIKKNQPPVVVFSDGE